MVSNRLLSTMLDDLRQVVFPVTLPLPSSTNQSDKARRGEERSQVQEPPEAPHFNPGYWAPKTTRKAMHAYPRTGARPLQSVADHQSLRYNQLSTPCTVHHMTPLQEELGFGKQELSSEAR